MANVQEEEVEERVKMEALITAIAMGTATRCPTHTPARIRMLTPLTVAVVVVVVA